MQVISLNVGLPKQVNWKGKIITTGIFKEAVNGRKKILKNNLEGDGQADLSVHGGEFKSIYAYASEHYDYWKQELNMADIPWGMFGENLTIFGGLFEDEINIGDRFRAGTAELIAVQPRIPCFKLGIRFGFPQIIKKFSDAKLCGIYFKIFKEGEISPGDNLDKIFTDKNGVKVRDIFDLLHNERNNRGLLSKAITAPDLAPHLKEYFVSRIAKLS